MYCGSKPVFMATVMMGVGLALLEPAAAQEAVTGPQAGVSAEMDRAQLETYVNVLKGELERAEARVVAVTAQLATLDADIESRMNRIVSLLSSVRDSADAPGSRMRKAKEEALAGLKASAVYYAQQRDMRKKAMGDSFAQIDDEALARDVAALNARIETRVTQALDIASSLAQQEEGRVDRHETTDTDYSSETREYRRVQSDARASAIVKTELVGTLRASIDKLSRDVKAREADLRVTTDAQRQAQLAEDIKTMNQTIDIRRTQIENLLTAPKPSTRSVGGKAAFEMDKMLDEMALELKADFAKFKHLVNEGDAARARLKPLKERLEKATALLQTRQPGNQSVNNP
jgi:hypothetical protein